MQSSSRTQWTSSLRSPWHDLDIFFLLGSRGRPGAALRAMNLPTRSHSLVSSGKRSRDDRRRRDESERVVPRRARARPRAGARGEGGRARGGRARGRGGGGGVAEASDVGGGRVKAERAHVAQAAVSAPRPHPVGMRAALCSRKAVSTSPPSPPFCSPRFVSFYTRSSAREWWRLDAKKRGREKNRKGLAKALFPFPPFLPSPSHGWRSSGVAGARLHAPTAFLRTLTASQRWSERA